MKMHNYISLNLLSMSSYAGFAALRFVVAKYYQDVEFARINNLDEGMYMTISALPIAIFFLGFVYLVVFLLACFLIELFVRVKFKKQGGCIRFKNEILGVVHVILFYFGIALLPFVNPFWFAI